MGAGAEGAHHVQVDAALGRLDQRAGGGGEGVVERFECFLDVDLYDGVAAWERDEQHIGFRARQRGARQAVGALSG